MLLSGPQMMLYALKLWGERGQGSKSSHLYSRNHLFLLARHRHFRFRLGGRAHERRAHPTLPLVAQRRQVNYGSPARTYSVRLALGIYIPKRAERLGGGCCT